MDLSPGSKSLKLTQPENMANINTQEHACRGLKDLGLPKHLLNMVLKSHSNHLYSFFTQNLYTFQLHFAQGRGKLRRRSQESYFHPKNKTFYPEEAVTKRRLKKKRMIK